MRRATGRTLSWWFHEAVQFEGQDEVMGFPSRWAFGFSPQWPGGVPSRPGSTFGMVAMNGSAAYADIGPPMEVHDPTVDERRDDA